MPSATETLHALGVEPVGITRFCDAAGANGPQVVGGTKNPDLAAIVALAPDLVVVNDEENRVEDARALDRRGSDVALDVAAIGDRGRARGARPRDSRSTRRCPHRSVADEWDDWLVSMLTPRWWDAFVAVWRRPWMSLAVDTYGASLLDLLGVGNVFADSLDRYPEVTLDGGRGARAERRAAAERAVRVRRRATSARCEAAVPGVPVELIDGRDLFWWGIRTPGRGRSPAPRVQSPLTPVLQSPSRSGTELPARMRVGRGVDRSRRAGCRVDVRERELARDG